MIGRLMRTSRRAVATALRSLSSFSPSSTAVKCAVAVAASGDAVIAVGGSWGTLAEIAFAMRLGRPVVVLDGPSVEGVPRAQNALEAVEMVHGRL